MCTPRKMILLLAILLCRAGRGFAATAIGSITISGTEQSSGGTWNSGAVTATIQPVTPVPQIMFNGRNIARTTQSVVAGQQIVLPVSTPSGYSIQSRSWVFSNQSAITGGFTNLAGNGLPSASEGGQEAADP